MRLLILWCLPAAMATPAFAQSSLVPAGHVRHPLPFLDGTDVGLTNVDGKVVFEASIQPHLVVVDNLEERWTVCEKSPAACRLAFRISATPGVRLRMFLQEPSSPVRTPSYMPRVTFQWLWLASADSNRVRVYGVQATVGHHSNGQAECLATDPVGICVEHRTDVSRYEVIRTSGSFSTNFIRLAAWYRPTRVFSTGERANYTVGATYEAHPKGFLGGSGISGLLAEEYGRHRVGVNATGNWGLNDNGAHIEGRASVTYLAGATRRVPRDATELQVSWFPGRSDWGVFVDYYRGQDYYNAGFADSVQRVFAGGTYTYDGFFLFR